MDEVIYSGIIESRLFLPWKSQRSCNRLNHMNQFKAKLDIIDINPFAFVPSEILEKIFLQAAKNKSPIPVRGTINGKPYKQTLIKFRGEWRLYINMAMLKESPRRIGEIIEVEIEFDPSNRAMEIHPKLEKAIAENKEAKYVFDGLPPSRQKEINRYIYNLKTETSIDKNVRRAINFLHGKERFIGRDKP